MRLSYLWICIRLNLKKIVIVVRALQLRLIVATINGLNWESKYGAICGILVPVLLIVSHDIINLIFGFN